MKFWFDLSNSPHINLFEKMIKELKKEHEVIITCRPLANTIELLELKGLTYHVVGKHYGGKLTSKLFGYPIRVMQLSNFLKKYKPDIAISQSSFHSPVAAKLLGIPSIYMNDNEHAMGNVPAFIFAKKILIPEFLDINKIKKQKAREDKIIQYPGLKEGIYLWGLSIERETDITKKNIYIRPEPWIAQYYKGAKNFMDNLILSLKDKYNIVLSPRGNEQARHYEEPQFEGIHVLKKPLNVQQIASDCLIFIGAGGTMTREMAVLGVPTISVYQDELLEVDEYLIKQGLMVHRPHVTSQEVISFIENTKDSEPNTLLLDKGKETYSLIKQLLLNKLK